MTTNLTSFFFTAALAAAMLTASANEVQAQKNVSHLWTSKQSNLSAISQNSSFAKINALVSKPGNSQDYVSAGSGNWQLQTKSAYTYDTQGRLTQRLYTDPTTNQNLGRESITYDAKGNESEYRAEAWSGSTWDLVDGYKSQYSYNAKGNKTEVVNDYWDPNTNAWVKDGREETAYDANDLVTSLTYSSWNGSAWSFDDRMVLSNVGGVGTTAIMQEYNNGTWHDTYRAQNLTWYLPYDIPSAYVLEYFDNNVWVKEEKYASVYDANGGHAGIYEVWNGITWEKSSRETESFDNNKNYTGWKEESWNGTTSTWDYDGEERQVLTYSGIDVTQRLFQNSWGSQTGTLEDQNKEVYSNFQTFSISGVKDLLAENSINVFPNPATDKIQIISEAIKGAFTATVSDVTGKTWLTESFNSGKAASVNVESLPAGVYLLQLQTESGSITKRIVKL